jgi:hypothetical protein
MSVGKLKLHQAKRIKNARHKKMQVALDYVQQTF